MRHSTRYLWLGLIPLALACQGEFIDSNLPGGNNPPTSNPQLAIHIGGTSSEEVVDLASDAAGNGYVTGTFTGSADFDPGTGVTSIASLGGSDVFLAKYDPAGALVWVSRIGGTGSESVTSLARDAAGNLYLGGSFDGSVDFDPGVGLQVLTSTGGRDGYVVKFAGDGSLVWARRFGGPSSDGITDVAVDAAQNVYAAGSFSGQADALPTPGPTILSAGLGDGFLVSFDAGGAVRFALPIGGTQEDAAQGVGVSAAGVVSVAGTFNGSADFARNAAPFNVSSQGGTDAYLASYSPAGVLIRVLDLGGTGDQSVVPGGLAIDAAGGAAVLGTFSGATDFDPGIPVVSRNSVGTRDVFLSRFDASGAFVSAAVISGAGSATPSGLALDPGGDAVVTGAFSGTLDFDPSAGTTALTSLGTGGGTDAFVARYSGAGSFLWVSRMGESTVAGERRNSANAAAVDGAGALLVGGRFFGAPDFDPGSSAFRVTSFGQADAFVIKLTSSGALAVLP